MRAPVRLQIVIDTYRVGGPGKVLLEFCAHARTDVQPHVLVFERGRRAPRDFRDACARQGLPVDVVREHHRFDLSIVPRSVGVVASAAPDLVQTHGYKANMVGLMSRGRLAVPWLAFSHGWTDEGRAMRCYRRVDDLVIRLADRIVTVSTPLRDALVADGVPPERVTVVPNAVRVPEAPGRDRDAMRAELGLSDAEVIAGVVGRLSPEKGHAVLLEALAALAARHPRLRTIIVGDGPAARELQARAAALGVPGAARFLGYRSDMPDIYAALDFLILPSLSEGMPNVALEAMAHGLAVLATRVGGVPDVVRDGITGVLVPAGNAAALAAGIERMACDRDMRVRMAEAGRARAARDFSPQARATRLVAVYDELLEQWHARQSRLPKGRTHVWDRRLHRQA